MYKKIATLVFLILHLGLFGINAAEWGDSYRILRASEYIRSFSYPSDEKRPPLFSAALALRPSFIDSITFGRIFMLLVSITLFLLFMKLCDTLEPGARKIAYILFIFNPVLLYWSLRIYADTFFALFVLLIAYLYFKWRNSLTKKHILVFGLLCALSVLTRFEGYILTAALLVGLIFPMWPKINVTSILSAIKSKYSSILIFTLSFALVVIPYFIIRNPFNSSYFDEPGGRTYDLTTLIIFLVSTLFILGFSQAAIFISGIKSLFITPFLSTFILGEMLLILLWPAAIPRLFIPLVPFFIIAISRSVYNYFKVKNHNAFIVTFISFFLLGLMIAAQVQFKLQFLVSMKHLFFIVVFMQLLISVSLFFRKFGLFLILLSVSLIVWSLSVIYIHKDIYSVVKNASIYIRDNLVGTVAYNDVSSVSDWYLNVQKKEGLRGEYFNYMKKKDLDFESLKQKNYDYLSLTNEHNTDTTLDIESRPYLSLEREFSQQINGKNFWTKVIKFNKNYVE